MVAFQLVSFIKLYGRVLSSAQLPNVTIENSPEEYFTDGTQNIQLTCNTDATNVLEFQWTKDGEIISDNSNYEMTFALRSSTLTVLSFSSALAGRYTCVASTSQGRISSQYVPLRRACKLFCVELLILLRERFRHRFVT